MKYKKVCFVVAIVCTIMVGSFLIHYMSDIRAYQRMQNLEGVTIVLDAGHGGKDDGAQSGSIKEQGINLDITRKLKDLLADAGANVILTRDGDYDLADESATSRKRSDMEKRVALINDEQVDLFLSIHLNSYTNTSVSGAQAFYKKRDDASKAFADIVQDHLKALTQTKMTSKSGDYYILNKSSKVGVLVECGFLSNAQDRTKLITDEYQQQLAQTLYDSITEYFAVLAQ